MRYTTAASLIALSLAFTTGIIGADIIGAPKAALAAEKEKPAKTVSPKVGKPLQEALAALKAGKAADGLVKAQEAEKITGKTAYENYMVNQVLASLYLQTKDYGNAIKALEGAVNSGEMPEADAANTIKQISSSYYAMKNYPKSIEYGARYIKDVNPNDTDMQILVAQAQYLQKNYKATSEGIRAAVRSAQAAGKPVKEDWLQLLMSSEHELGNDAGTQSALEQLIALNSKDEYWKNLIAYAERGLRGGTTKTELDTYVVKFQVGTIATPQEYAAMAELALQDGLPGLAKKVLDKGIADKVLGQGAAKEREGRLSTMANTQADADQKALGKGEAEARNAKSGDPLVKMGEAYWSYGQYDKAVELIQAGIAKGVTNADDAKLRLGIAYAGGGKRTEALAAFKGITAGTVPAQLGKLWALATTSPPSKKG